jgi:plasmid maintenance system antidote protein VapI
MRYILKENVDVDFGVVKDYEVAERIGIHKVTLSNILNRKVSTTKPIALYITILNGGKEKNIEDYFEPVKKGE